ncbi:hypothetical protein AMK59_145 [Oryctes borbonicus]|uniref:Scavenger receptor class B member 1 n=1 Tax=Oryctes borbonicus TaxID=1629725 RepID=A0A0T6BF94_9SCAR|nr:hypothetical protein AMK59_145 [Oryctes borbonicus]
MFWFTNTLDSYIMQNLMLVNGTEAFEGWIHPKARTLIKVHIFNYTNVKEFDEGIETRLRVQELGPYVYEEVMERNNVYFENDGTITFQNSFKHKFLPHLSKGKQSDVVVVPNIMVLSAAYKTKDMDYFTKLAASMTLGGFMNKKPFMKLAAHRYIWGYDDSVYYLAKGFMAFQSSNMQDQIGLMSARNGTSPYVMSVHTGQRNMQKYGILSKVNGFDTIGQWSAECDSVAASDGSLFPPNLVRNKQDVDIYFPELCRKFKYTFQEEVKIINNTVPAYRYVMPDSVFDSPDKEPSNQCYCDHSSGTCAPQGFYNITTCAFGAPIFMSRPHFSRVRPEDIKVDGINPRHKDVTSYADLHPTMGFPIAGMTRLQMNILAKSYPGFYSMNMFDRDGMMLPLAWMDSGLEDQYINREYLEVIYLTTFTVKQVELAIKYITLLTAVITLTAIIIILKEKIRSYAQSSSSQHLNSQFAA